MPLYDYKCTKCGYIFEVQQRITEEPLKHCPKCKEQIRRLISPAGIIFKGSGFHVTDYGKKTKAEKPKSGQAESAKKEEKPKAKESSAKVASPKKSE